MTTALKHGSTKWHSFLLCSNPPTRSRSNRGIWEYLGLHPSWLSRTETSVSAWITGSLMMWLRNASCYHGLTTPSICLPKWSGSWPQTWIVTFDVVYRNTRGRQTNFVHMLVHARVANNYEWWIRYCLFYLTKQKQLSENSQSSRLKN